ncbi:MAG: uroporphyrinogen-III C-methyltransferase [Anaerolineae bacterium]
MNRTGIVYLIGAGPGDPKLITVRGLEYLREADVVVYDYLASPQLLREARPQAELIYVGKMVGQHTLAQEEINRLLVERAQQGKVVARLKGGDPFVFGRGGEEAEALAAAGVPFEVVPGVTSAVAAPAYAGIPVSHRGYTSAFAVVTGHSAASSRLGFTAVATEPGDRGEAASEDPTRGKSSLDWAALSRIGTLVLLMGVGNLPQIVEALLRHGRSPQTPVALVCWGTTSRQETVVGTLADIVERVEVAGLKPPAVIVVGETVGLREKLRWFDRPERRPLLGKRVLVTRARAQASTLLERLAELGAEPIEFPTIRIVPAEDYGPLDQAIQNLDAYDWVIFTSVNGVKFFLQRLGAAGKDARALAGVSLCAIGPATATALRDYWLRVDYMPPKYVAEEIVTGLGEVAGQRILLPRAAEARALLARELRAKGATVDEVVAYRTVLAQEDSPDGGLEIRYPQGSLTPTGQEVGRMLLAGQIDVVTFTSSSTVRNFVALLDGVAPSQALAQATVACIGPITAATARELGIRVDLVAEEHTVEGLVGALVGGKGQGRGCVWRVADRGTS